MTTHVFWSFLSEYPFIHICYLLLMLSSASLGLYFSMEHVR